MLNLPLDGFIAQSCGIILRISKAGETNSDGEDNWDRFHFTEGFRGFLLFFISSCLFCPRHA